MDSLVIHLLGNPEIRLGEQPLSFRTRKVLALLVYLVMERGMHSRESLMALLWPESSQSSAAATLRTTLSRLHLMTGFPPSVKPAIVSWKGSMIDCHSTCCPSMTAPWRWKYLLVG